MKAAPATRNPRVRKPKPASGLFDELIVDYFAGGGGASTGIEAAIGRAVDVAVNHDRDAIAMHAANHPHTLHLCDDVWTVDPRKATGGRKVGLLWASPDCKHFSRAKGGKPVEKKIRGLAWVVVKVAKAVKPRVIMLENVREFEDWGPLKHVHGADGKPLYTSHGEPVMLPDRDRKGVTFRRWVGCLRSLGYVVEWRPLDAADYGAPTHRKRLFLIARRDGLPIVWPLPTHGPKAVKGKSYRTAAECINWTLPCPSIFGRKKPLAEKTMRRIAMGLKRYVLDNPKPFIVRLAHGDGKDGKGRWGRNHQGTGEPLPTVTASKDFAIVTPTIVGVGGRAGQSPATGGNDPLGTITAKNDRAVVAATLVQTGYGERKGQAPRVPGVEKPLGTVVSGGQKHALTTAYLTRICQNGSNGHNVKGADEPTTTIVSKAEHCLTTATLIGAGGSDYAAKPRAVDRPAGTVTTETHAALVTAFIVKHFGGMVGVPAITPLPTTTARGTQNQVATAHLVRFNHDDDGVAVDRPSPTITAQSQHIGLVYSFLTKYFSTGAIGSYPADPLPTATGKARFGLVTVTIDGQPYVIADIGMRMLTPRELARCQGFPDDYHLTGTKTSQVARIGNSVCPVMAEVLVRANLTGGAA